ncbi:hypothetical protein ABBQ32_000343 [Trebouxia sp. C0010 RCD-2024]
MVSELQLISRWKRDLPLQFGATDAMLTPTSTGLSVQKCQQPYRPLRQPFVRQTHQFVHGPDRPQQEPKLCRRLISIGIIGLICEVSEAAFAKPVITHKEVDDDSSALVQGLLAKSKENKERYTKERLQDYYRRNFKDYFTYEKGLGQSSSERGLSDENQQKILKWLNDNP